MYLSLDLGTTTGWAVDDGSVIVSGTVAFKNGRFEGGGMRYLQFRDFLREMKDKRSPVDAVYFEEVRSHKGVDAAHVYGGLLALLTAWCEHHGVAYQGVPVATIKRHATGKGNSPKEAMIKAATDRGHAPSDDNEADALAIAYWRRDGAK